MLALISSPSEVWATQQSITQGIPNKSVTAKKVQSATVKNQQKTKIKKGGNHQLSRSKGNFSIKFKGLDGNAGGINPVLIQSALDLLGTPYRFGGQTPLVGFDCSGFVGFVFKQSLGITLPRSARGMAELGHSIAPTNLQAGDLVFFNTRKRVNSHVGIYLGGGEFIHAPTRGGHVRIDRLDAQWARTFEVARRYSTENKDLT